MEFEFLSIASRIKARELWSKRVLAIEPEHPCHSGGSQAFNLYTEEKKIKLERLPSENPDLESSLEARKNAQASLCIIH